MPRKHPLPGLPARDRVIAGDESWLDDAECRRVGATADFFFIDRGEAQTLPRTYAICDACPVRDECLWTALLTSERYGIWGGATSTHRRQIAKDLRAAGMMPARFESPLEDTWGADEEPAGFGDLDGA